MEHGSVHASEGGHFSYRVIGPCCRLFDREDLPWPSCSLAFKKAYGINKSKQPSWRRIGSRFVPDIAARRCPSYSVDIIQPGFKATPTILTFFSSRFEETMQEWWYSRHPKSKQASNIYPSE
ncbi:MULTISPECIES: hypothetical protein [unclassified Prochlorococcus]|uniref:hypothetical protein n=1 Tax=unclassified Prochlorococcus TaxID=2627481 RepID=UPI000533BB75|nr:MULTISPECIES: hypothetical protein [unclassified Prochlorococcus]KGG16203.1 hypothetical protein EV07_1370 [Prochlorococcus sp. MIT 0603]KGG18062.1 hypothetical protein EV06_0190 [Prochlorococcus sp. MIT 0602]